MADPASLPTPAMENESSDYSYLSDTSSLSELSSPPDSPQPAAQFYPSPPPTQDDQQQPLQEKRARASSSQDEPAKKRRRVGPPPRSTQLLDLTDSERLPYGDQRAQINLLTKTLRSHRKIVVIAGAGISTSAGSKSSLDFF
jgi:NAD+-dependent protein deacetylase SIR2